MRGVLTFLARRRWAGVGLALLAEVVLLATSSLAPDNATVGVRGAVAAAIAGTVAVVFGILDGVIVALVGALVFAALSSWEVGALVAIGVWPVIVAAAGLFARRVDQHRAALRRLVEAEEDERRTLASTLHDDTAQTLAGALFTLRAGLDTGPEQARDLVNETIKQLRGLALELSPRALDDYGLAAALSHLADDGTSDVSFETTWDGRLAGPDERTLFRFAQAALRTAREHRAERIALDLAAEGGRVSVSLRASGVAPANGTVLVPTSLAERIAALDGRVQTRSTDGELVLSANLPLHLA